MEISVSGSERKLVFPKFVIAKILASIKYFKTSSHLLHSVFLKLNRHNLSAFLTLQLGRN
ncbi:MAG: hypothetical protein DWQ06_01730 [Calditrichaeota bacterium]|nr:MAG: hypothetical protein DWQ06_01730 [Calditrichota bacterium]